MLIHYENYAHLSKLKDWTQRHVEYGESKTLMAVLQDRVPGKQTHPKGLRQTLYFLMHKSLPGSHWLSPMGCTSFPICHLNFLLGLVQF
jgi:hypothetical protein